MSLQGITDKGGSSAELDVAVTNVKDGASIPLSETATLSLSTVGLNSITDETTELREDEVQPVDVASDGKRDEAEEEDVAADEEDGIREDDVSLAPSLAQSLAPSLASIKSVTDAVAAAAIQCIAPTNAAVDEHPLSSDQSVVSSSKSVTAKEAAAGDFDDEDKSRASTNWSWTNAAGATQDTILQSTTSVSVSRSRSNSSKHSKLSNASKSKESDPVVVVEAPVQSMEAIPAARSGSSIKSSKSSKSNHSTKSSKSTKSNRPTKSNRSTKSIKPSIEQQPLMEENNNFSDQISKTPSQQSTTSKTSIGGIVIEGHLVTVVPMRSPVADDNATQDNEETIEVNTTKLMNKEQQNKTKVNKKQKQKKKIAKVSFFTAKTDSETKKVIFFPLTKKKKMNKNKSEVNNNSSAKKKGGWLKKLSQRKKKQPRDTKSSSVTESAPAVETEDVASSQFLDVVQVQSTVQAEQKIDSAEDNAQEVVTKASTVVIEEEAAMNTSTEAERQVVMNASTVLEKPTTEKDTTKGFDCCSPAAIWGNANGWFNKDPAKAKEEVAAESMKGNVVAEVRVEEKKDIPDDEHLVMNTSAEGAEMRVAETDVANGFDCSAPSAVWGKVSGWLLPMSAQESLYGSADVAVGKTETGKTEEVEEVEKMESIEEAQVVMCIEEIKARWFPGPEEPKPSLDEETAADISQAVHLLNAQRALIKETEDAIKAEEGIIQGAENVQDFQAAEENKARLKRELTNAKRLEKAAKELVHHLFNSLTASARLEAIRLSDEIAKADEEVAEDDGIDFGCFQLDPYFHTVKQEYGDYDDDSAILLSNSNVVDVPIKISRAPSAISKTLSSKSSIKEDTLGE